ncbi:hypothetical protein MUN78_04225 [Leucobacter allii]|uniref:Lipid/polyisoprenoid-binding YceI-like domain-containing protein n=1 Tax=Leucobacter allii TaxID=2932247 RepID=A0ABY4FP53_9MICO|nr:hypothetical protein [Leucobacter allii]UOQ58058.1 hypothetical protein MUN78_04225 [Leucobacter allii]UOR02695.1 hypothetical protein MUN77_05120 [Leucobacter allii]
MSVTRVSRSVRVFGVVATVSAALPFALTGCSPAADIGAQAAELQAAAGSDVLEVPVVTIYDVTDAELTSAEGEIGGSVAGAFAAHVETSGYFVLNDGVITGAELRARLAAFPEAKFVLTQPTVLRREGGDPTVTAVGTLSVNGIVHQEAQLRLTPTKLDEESAEFDLDFDIPDSPLTSGADLPVDEISAHLVLSAR